MINQEIFEQQAKELASIDSMAISMPSEHGYMLAATVQAAARCLDLPETTNAFCREFVNAFCDRYRGQLPTVVMSIERAWEDEMVTEEEFDESLGEKWRRIAADVQREMGDQVRIIVDTLDDDDLIESIFAVAPHDHDPETYDY